MLLTALVQTKGGTLVVDLPRDRIDLEIKIRSIGIQKTSDQIHVVDNEDCDVSVKLFGDSDIGKHLSLLFGEDNTLLEVNKTLQTVENSIEDSLPLPIADSICWMTRTFGTPMLLPTKTNAANRRRAD